MIQNIKLHGGIITYNGMEGIDFSKPLEQYQDILDEDLLQIQYSNNYVVDVGWYPSFELTGGIVIRVIKNSNWEKPILEKEPEKDNFLNVLQECIDFVSEKCKKTKL